LPFLTLLLFSACRGLAFYAGSDKVMSVVSVEQRGPMAIVAIDRPEKLR
jgi:hypothetical protein